MTRQTFERDLPHRLEDLYLGGTPDYRDDLVRRIAATRQRSAWTLPERWLPMDLALRRTPAGGLPLRTAMTFLVLMLLVAALAVAALVGSQSRLAPPLGPAGNGPLVYSANGDIFVRDGLTGESRVLIGGAEADSFPGFNGQGSQFLFERTIDDDRYLMVADADGTNVRRVLDEPIRDPWISWSIDGRQFAITDRGASPRRTLRIVSLDSGATRTIDLGKVAPTEVQWRPPDGQELLVRVAKLDGTFDFLTVGIDGQNIRPFNLPSPMLYGADWELTGTSWSQDGRHIAYNQVQLDAGVTHFRIHVMNADGTGDRMLPGPAAHVNEAWPHFSPDGKWILAQRFDFGSSTSWLAITPADGSGPGRDIGPVHKDTPGVHNNMRHGWSPDGTKVLLRYNDTEFWVIDPVSGAYEALAWPSAEDLPDWRRVAR